ncbi:MAG: hypothetical protein Q4C70_08940 [Planctomycetia bacterium]|nr:hypothetical protein [Planctomycetia bacterium]
MKRELLELKQKLMQRFLDNAIDQATYDRMLAEIDAMAEQEESIPSSVPPGASVVNMPAGTMVVENGYDSGAQMSQNAVLPPFVTVLPAGAPMQMSAQYFTPGQYPGAIPGGVPSGYPGGVPAGYPMMMPNGMINGMSGGISGGIPTPYGMAPGNGLGPENTHNSMMSADKLEVRTATGVKPASVWQEEVEKAQNAPNPEIDPLVVKALKDGETLEVWWHFPLTPECVAAWKKIDVPLRLSLAMNEYIDDEALQLLGQITNLHEINLTSTRITNSGIRYLSRLANLESLILTSTEITGETFNHLDECENLRELTLTSTPFSNDGMAFLSQFQHLDSLKLDDTNITDEGMPALEGLHQLQLLNLQGTLVSDIGLKSIAHLTSLIELYLGGTIPLDGDDYESPITDKGIAFLKELAELRVLHLNDTQVTNACIASLKKMTELYELNVTDTYFSDDALKQLRRFRNLGDVNVEGTLITEAGVKKIFGREGTKIFRGARTGSWNKLGRFLVSPWSRKN